jgi:Alpha/beta hydrolase of unknown function (DUF900)
MLKLVWTPGAAAAPDAAAYRQAIDTLAASYGSNNATAQIPRGTAAPDLSPLTSVIRAWLAARTVPNAAVKLMLHGYDYDPRHVGDPAYDPFATIYGYPGDNALNPRLSWLPLVEECNDAGTHRQETAIAFAWVSTGSLAEYATAGWSESYQYACVDLAVLAANAVAAVLRALAAEGVVVDVIAHSLGTRLFTKAVAALGANDAMINNVVLLDGAEFSVDAAATFAGRNFNVVNVTNEVDAVLTTGAEQLGDPSRTPGSVPSCSLGRYGLGKPGSWIAPAIYPPNWVDLSLDRRDLQAWFQANGGYSLTPTASDSVHPEGQMNHWACYTEPGNRAWLTDLLWKPGLNGGALVKVVSLPKGVLGDPQPVFAGVGIPATTPMTMAARMAFQRGAGQGGGS